MPCIAWVCIAGVLAADPPTPPVLRLTNDGFVSGEPLASDDPAVWRWRSPAFTDPLEFPSSAVRGLYYPVPPAPPRPAGEYRFELDEDDVIFGDLIALTDDEVELTAAPFGRLRLRRDHVRHVSRLDRSDLVYAGPTGLAGWTDPSERWREEGGQPYTDQPGAYVFNDIGLPERAVVELALAWKGRPNFVLALGADDRDAAAKSAFRFEVWDDQVVAVGESDRDADAIVVGPVKGGRLRVRAFLDQPQRRLVLLSRSNDPLAVLAVGGTKPPSRTGVRLTNTGGDVRLELLRVTKWAGPPPGDAPADPPTAPTADGSKPNPFAPNYDRPRVRRSDGTTVFGRLAAYDPTTKRFTVRDGEAETVVPHDEVLDVYVPPPPAGPPAPEPPAVRVVGRDGTQLTGTPTRIEDTHVTLSHAGVREPLRVPWADVRSVVPLRYAGEVGTAVAGRPGKLELDGVSLKGRFVADDGPAAAGRPVWLPDLAWAGVPLVPGVSGRVVYRESPRSSAAQPGRPAGLRAVVVDVLGGGRPVAPATAPRPPAVTRRSLHLRTGDAIPCEVTRIDDRGVTFKSAQTDATFVPNEKVKSVELIALAVSDIDAAKRDRLLTLPRSQRGTPPTHLVCSKTGDFLRGHVAEMDDARLRVEVRLETRDIPRDRVAQIIWLHPDELTAEKPPTPPAAGQGTRVQTVAAGGNRLTFVLDKTDAKMVSGTSDVLGPCRANLADLDELLFGAAIERSAAELAYHKWKLRHAADPKFAQADGGSGGVESPLVGRPAPPVELDMLDGGRFKLADRKGRVVILDFWATWCGPCIQSLPAVAEVAREFADRGVELVAVNMEEPADQVRAMLERHKLAVPVALDRDGVAAARYAVTAIPHTVIVGRDGKVTHLFVGGGKATAEALHAAVRGLVEAQ